MDLLARVKQRDTKMKKGLKGPYEKRVRELGLFRLEKERQRGHLITVCKYLKGRCKEDRNRLFWCCPVTGQEGMGTEGAIWISGGNLLCRWLSTGSGCLYPLGDSKAVWTWPWEPALGKHVWEGGWTRGPPTGLSNISHSVILLLFTFHRIYIMPPKKVRDQYCSLLTSTIVFNKTYNICEPIL